MELTRLFVKFGADDAELKKAMGEAEQAVKGMRTVVKTTAIENKDNIGESAKEMSSRTAFELMKMGRLFANLGGNIVDSIAPGMGQVVTGFTEGFGLIRSGMKMMSVSNAAAAASNLAVAGTSGVASAAMATEAVTAAAAGTTIAASGQVAAAGWMAILGPLAIVAGVAIGLIMVFKSLYDVHAAAAAKTIADNEAEASSALKLAERYDELRLRKMKLNKDTGAGRQDVSNKYAKQLQEAADEASKAGADNAGTFFRGSEAKAEEQARISAALAAKQFAIKKQMAEELKILEAERLQAEKEMQAKALMEHENFLDQQVAANAKGRDKEIIGIRAGSAAKMRALLNDFENSTKTQAEVMVFNQRVIDERERARSEEARANEAWDKKDLQERLSHAARILGLTTETAQVKMAGLTKQLASEEAGSRREEQSARDAYAVSEQTALDKIRLDETIAAIRQRSATRQEQLTEEWKKQEHNAMASVQDRVEGLNQGRLFTEQQRYAREIEQIQEMEKLKEGASEKEKAMYQEVMEYKQRMAKILHEDEMRNIARQERAERASFINSLSGRLKAERAKNGAGTAKFQDVAEISRQVLLGAAVSDQDPTAQELIKFAKQEELENQRNDIRHREVVTVLKKSGLYPR